MVFSWSLISVNFTSDDERAKMAPLCVPIYRKLFVKVVLASGPAPVPVHMCDVILIRARSVLLASLGRSGNWIGERHVINYSMSQPGSRCLWSLARKITIAQLNELKTNISILQKLISLPNIKYIFFKDTFSKVL